MKFSLLPRGKGFYRLLEALSSTTQEAVKDFHQLVLEWKEPESRVKNLKVLEERCDAYVHEIMVKLNKTFVTPIDREDIHYLAKKIDDLMDITHATANKMQLFHIKSVKKKAQEIAIVLEKATTLVMSAVFMLSQSKKAAEILRACVEVNKIEDEGDRLFECALSQLFHEEKDPLEVIKWKEIYDSLEEAMDTCEDISNILWNITVKYG